MPPHPPECQVHVIAWPAECFLTRQNLSSHRIPPTSPTSALHSLLLLHSTFPHFSRTPGPSGVRAFVQTCPPPGRPRLPPLSSTLSSFKTHIKHPLLFFSFRCSAPHPLTPAPGRFTAASKGLLETFLHPFVAVSLQRAALRGALSHSSQSLTPSK